MTHRVEPKNDRLRPAWRFAEIVDGKVAVLMAIAIALTAGALFWTRFVPATDWGPFALVAPLVAAAFFVAMIFMLAERDRHGLVRGILLLGAGVLAATGSAFVYTVGWAWVIASYFTPAALALISILMLERARVQRRKAEQSTSVRREAHP